MEVKKEVLIDIILSSIEGGLNPSQIAKEQKISKQRLNYYLRKLKDQGLIKKIGYGVWERSKKGSKITNEVRGHGFLWKLRIPKNYEWESILEKKNIKFKKQGIKDSIIQIQFKEKKIWLTKKHLILHDVGSYFGRNAIESRKYAVEELLVLLRGLESKLGVSLQINGDYQTKIGRQHYALMKNNLAIQCNKEGKKISVSNAEGQWFLIDNSYNLDEAETVHKKTALVDNIGIQKYFNEHKELKFQMTPKNTLEMIHGIAANQQMFNQNFESHVEAIKTLSSTVKELQKEIKELRKLKNAK